jgi:hypothetical protein
MRDCYDGELTILYLDEINPIAWPQTERSPYLSRDCDLAFRAHSGCSLMDTYGIDQLHDN